MQPVTDPAYQITAESDSATVVFLRPSRFGGGINSSVFQTDNEQSKLVGMVPSRAKVAYRVSPGKHMFMVVGESADFMEANLEAGKIYYAIVAARMGAWKARFSLRPVDAGENEKLDKYLNACKWVKLSPAARAWATKNSASIEKKRNRYFEKWQEKASGDQPMLLPEYGR